jgi:resuscitation-promoting factor RpfB
MRKIRFKKFSSYKYVFTKRRRWLRLKNHPLIVPVMTFLILLAGTGVAYVFLGSKPAESGTSHIVILTENRTKQTLPTDAPTVGELIKRLSIKLHEGDIVEPSQDTQIVEDNFRINVYRAQPITIVEGDKKTFTLSAATTPRSIAAQAGLKVYPEDNLTIQIPDSVLRTASIGQELVIVRSTPVYLNLYGTPIAVRTHVKTVGELLKEKQVKLESSDNVQPSASTPITANMIVVVSRQGTQIVTETEEIPAPTQIIEDNSLSFGTQAVRQQGSPGKKIVTYQINTTNGQEQSRQKIQEVIAEQPVTHIIARGKAVFIPADKSAWMSAAGISPSDYPYVNYIMSRESGWCPTKLQGQIGYCPGFAPSYIPTNLGYGIGQATPGTKMAPYGADWQTNAVTQLRWAIAYTKGRYGTWEAAYNYWLSHRHW